MPFNLDEKRAFAVRAGFSIARTRVDQPTVNLSMKPLGNYFIRNRFIVAINRFYVWFAAITEIPQRTVQLNEK